MKRQEEKEMKKLYLEWKDSGMSKSAFAVEKEILHTTFYYRCIIFGKRDNCPWMLGNSPC